MNIIRNSRDLRSFFETLQSRNAGGDASVEQTVRSILEEVKRHGDPAVMNYTCRYDFRQAKKMGISTTEMNRHANKADSRVVKALEIAAKRIRKFHERQRDTSWFYTEGETILGQILRPLRRVGVYVPGGKASYPSTVLMNVIPAQVAGVQEIAVCVPTPEGHINPYVMAALKMLQVTEVYRIGGAQAVAALAFGTRSIRKVDKIVGPGNIYVATAKKMVFGMVDIDMIAGPSEILIIADDSADPSFVAADLLGQAEHDELASSILITPSSALAEQVSQEVDIQLSRLKRKRIVRSALDTYGAIIVTKDLKDAALLANSIAPEHLELMIAKPLEILSRIENAGAIFLGPWTPEALGDYAAGPNHTLPTGGTARFSSPLGVYDFVKRSSLLGFTKKGFLRLAPLVEGIADVEGLDAHKNTIRIRRGKK